MIYFKDTLDFKIDGKSAVTLGKFDGIHKGHQKLINEILSRKKDGFQSVLFTFGSQPDEVLSGARKPALMTKQERYEVLEKVGVDVLIECPFIPEFYKLSPESFVEEMLLERLHCGFIAVGTDCRFGHYAKGDAAFLQEHAGHYGFDVKVLPDEEYNGMKISSTVIRQMIAEGDMDTASAMLGYPYRIEGTIYDGVYTYYIPNVSGKMMPPAGKYPVELKTKDQTAEGILWIPEDIINEKSYVLELSHRPEDLRSDTVVGISFIN